MEVERESLKKMFPNLAKELNVQDMKVPITAVRTDEEHAERASSEDFSHYQPDVIGFLRRCDTEKQAEEIIEYLEKRGEVAEDYAARLMKQLKTEGVRSFGAKKENDYYLKHGETINKK